MVVVAIGTDGSFLRAVRDGAAVNAVPIRRCRRGAQSSLLHHEPLGMTRRARSRDRGVGRHRLRIGRRKDGVRRAVAVGALRAARAARFHRLGVQRLVPCRDGVGMAGGAVDRLRRRIVRASSGNAGVAIRTPERPVNRTFELLGVHLVVASEAVRVRQLRLLRDRRDGGGDHERSHRMTPTLTVRTAQTDGEEGGHPYPVIQRTRGSAREPSAQHLRGLELSTRSPRPVH